jgi:hypothetical protein
MMAPSRALQLICRVGAAARLRAALSRQLAEFQSAYAKPATPIQALQVRFGQPHETPDAAGAKNVCNQARFLKQK